MYQFNANLTLDQIAFSDRMATCFSNDEQEVVCLVKTSRQIKSEKNIRYCEDHFIVASFHCIEEHYQCNNASGYSEQKDAWKLFDEIRDEFLTNDQESDEEFFQNLLKVI